MIQFLKRIKGHSKVDSLECMLQVIEVLEKNFNADYRIHTNDWVILTKWLEKYYCEFKELYINERSKTQGIQTELPTEEQKPL